MYFSQPYCFNTCLTLHLVFTYLQANSDFWKVKYDHEAAKKAKVAAINANKTTWRSNKKKKSDAEDLMKLDDTSDSEVALDSLGQFFNNVIDIDHYQDDTRASQAGEAEVTIISSDSEPLPRHKVRRVIRKVRFSNP